MGTVMSYALGLGAERPAPAGILALSGFIPTVEGWTPALDEPARAARTKVFVSHGVHDPVIEVGFARRARGLLATGGFEVEYRETPAAHHLEPEGMRAAAAWAQALLPRGGALSSE
jgi:phospholipase/carboxylesterase